MKSPLYCLVLAAATIFGIIWYLARDWEKPADAQKTQTQVSKPISKQERVEELPKQARVIVDHPVLSYSSQFQAGQTTPEEDHEILTLVIGDFRRIMGENPIGENEEIFRALRGENPKNIRLLPDNLPGEKSDGIVLDRWGMPWRFHALSSSQMEIRSAGPDTLFGTVDDLTEWGMGE